MKKKNFKGRCERRSLGKCKEVGRTYSPIQYAYADLLETDEGIAEFMDKNGIKSLSEITGSVKPW